MLTPDTGVDVIAMSTCLLKPFTDVTVMTEVFECPFSMLNSVGEAAIPKSGVGGGGVTSIILSGTVALCSSVPLVPVTPIV